MNPVLMDVRRTIYTEVIVPNPGLRGNPGGSPTLVRNGGQRTLTLSSDPTGFIGGR